jgi:signal transduction histidine kinase
MRFRIRDQLLAPLLVLLLGVAGISTWTGWASVERARQQIETQVRNVARTLEEASFPLNARVLGHMKGLSGADFLLVAPEGRTSTLSAEVDDLPADVVADDWHALRLGPPMSIHGEAYLCGGLKLRQPGHTLYIFYPEGLRRDALWEAARPSVILGAGVGLASIALAIGVGQRLSRRILNLEQRTRQIAAGDFSPMPLPGRDDELRDLGRSVNEMAQRLAQLQEAVQKNERLRLLGQVSGGLAHQLRNGVTGARLAVQLHARKCTANGDREALDVAVRQLDLLEANLKRFLDLGRNDAPVKAPCSLNRLVTEVVALYRPQCRHAHIDLVWQPAESDPVVQGDAGQLGHLLVNVIGNAVEAAGPHGQVEIRCVMPGTRASEAESQNAECRMQNGQTICNLQSAICILEICDSGPGPQAKIAERLFEPFVTSKSEGVGLGLAVARQVVLAHGGRIDWRRENDRTCFCIELPRNLDQPQ